MDKLPTNGFPINLEYVTLLKCLENQTMFTNSTVTQYFDFLEPTSQTPEQQGRKVLAQKNNNSKSTKAIPKKKGRPRKSKKTTIDDEDSDEETSDGYELEDSVENGLNDVDKNMNDFSCIKYTIIGKSNQNDLIQNNNAKSIINLTSTRSSIGSTNYFNEISKLGINPDVCIGDGNKKSKTSSNSKGQTTLDIDKYFDEIYKGKRLPIYPETSLIQCFKSDAQDTNETILRPMSTANLTLPIHIQAIYPTFMSSLAHPSLETTSLEKVVIKKKNRKTEAKTIPSGKLCISCGARISPYRCVYCEAAYCSIECSKKHEILCLHKPY